MSLGYSLSVDIPGIVGVVVCEISPSASVVENKKKTFDLLCITALY